MVKVLTVTALAAMVLCAGCGGSFDFLHRNKDLPEPAGAREDRAEVLPGQPGRQHFRGDHDAGSRPALDERSGRRAVAGS